MTAVARASPVRRECAGDEGRARESSVRVDLRATQPLGRRYLTARTSPAPSTADTDKMEELSELAQLARRSAELDIASEPEPLLRGYGLSKEAWLELQDRFLAQIADDLDRGETERANLFSATYEHRRGELLGAEHIANDNGDQLTATASPAAPDVAGGTPAAPVLATFQQPASPAVAAEVDPDATAMVDRRAIADAAKTRAVPFDLNAPAIAVPPPKEIAEAQSGETQLTEALDLRAVLASRGIALAPEGSSAPNPSPVPTVPTVDVNATAEVDTRQLTAVLQQRGILPFDKNAPAAPPAASPPQQQSGRTELVEQLDLSAMLATRGIQQAAAPFASPRPHASRTRKRGPTASNTTRATSNSWRVCSRRRVSRSILSITPRRS